MKAGFKKAFLFAAALAAPAIAALPTAAQTVSTYGLAVPSEIVGLRYASAWQVAGPDGRKAVVVGYSGGAKGEAVAMIFEADAAAQAVDKGKLAKEMDYFIEWMGEKSNAAMEPKVVAESIGMVAGLPQQAATAHIKTRLFGVESDLHHFVTTLNGRLVAIRYKAGAGPNTADDAKAFAAQIGQALQAK
jgi:hypothetical protein